MLILRKSILIIYKGPKLKSCTVEVFVAQELIDSPNRFD